MRIIYIGPFRLPNYDAAAARVLNIARSLRLAGHEVSFISWGGDYRDKDKCGDGVYRVDGFPYIITHEIGVVGGKVKKALGWLKRGHKTKRILQERVSEYDAIITYDGGLAHWLIDFAKKNNKYLICDCSEWFSYKEMQIVEIPSLFINMHFLLHRIKNKIVISSYLDKHFRKSHNIVIPATCNASEEKWYTGKEMALAKVGDFEGVTLIYAGTPMGKDALHYAIQAISRLINEKANIRFLILGCERKDYLRSINAQYLNDELSDKIMFLGRVPQDDVPSFYALSDFMILLREQTRKSNAGFPTKFSESFTSSTPVIANLTSDLGEYLKDGITGFIVPEPSEESVYTTIKEKVLPLNRAEIEDMKHHVKEVSVQLDYHYFIKPLELFMGKLK